MNAVLKKLLIFEEDEKLTVYPDADGRAIGIGHSVSRDQTPEELSILGVEHVQDIGDDFTITPEQSHQLFTIDVDEAINDLYPAFSVQDLADLGDVRAAIIVSMCFQMGGRGVRAFKNFIGYVKDGDFSTASLEMLYADVDTQRPSAWYLETPERCQRAADAMASGEFNFLPADDEDPVLAISDNLRLAELEKYKAGELLRELLKRYGDDVPF